MTPSVPQPPPAVPLAALIRVGHEVAARARRLGALTLTAEIRAADGSSLLFRADLDGVWVTGGGYDLKVSELPEWERLRPPGT